MHINKLFLEISDLVLGFAIFIIEFTYNAVNLTKTVLQLFGNT